MQPDAREAKIFCYFSPSGAKWYFALETKTHAHAAYGHRMAEKRVLMHHEALSRLLTAGLMAVIPATA